MISTLSIDDFKLKQAVCELRYENAYLLYDRTGLICAELQRSFTHVQVLSAVPQQSVIQCDEGVFGLELGQCRFTSMKLDNQLERFADETKRFLDVALYNLDIKVFTRIGLRVFFVKEYKSLDEARSALALLKLSNIASVERFGAATEPSEVLFRWENTMIGTMLRLATGSSTVDLVVSSEIAPEKSEIHKSFSNSRTGRGLLYRRSGEQVTVGRPHVDHKFYANDQEGCRFDFR